MNKEFATFWEGNPVTKCYIHAQTCFWACGECIVVLVTRVLLVTFLCDINTNTGIKCRWRRQNWANFFTKYILIKEVHNSFRPWGLQFLHCHISAYIPHVTGFQFPLRFLVAMFTTFLVIYQVLCFLWNRCITTQTISNSTCKFTIYPKHKIKSGVVDILELTELLWTIYNTQLLVHW